MSLVRLPPAAWAWLTNTALRVAAWVDAPGFIYTCRPVSGLELSILLSVCDLLYGNIAIFEVVLQLSERQLVDVEI